MRRTKLRPLAWAVGSAAAVTALVVASPKAPMTALSFDDDRAPLGRVALAATAPSALASAEPASDAPAGADAQPPSAAPGGDPGSAGTGAKPEIPSLADDPPGPERTPRPTSAAWKDAPRARLARMRDGRCEVKRLREWLRIRCSLWGEKGFALIAGTREGIDLKMNSFGDESITVEFPVRRGDLRVMQLNGQAGRYGSAPEVIISERWLEHEPAPVISLTGAR